MNADDIDATATPEVRVKPPEVRVRPPEAIPTAPPTRSGAPSPPSPPTRSVAPTQPAAAHEAAAAEEAAAADDVEHRPSVAKYRSQTRAAVRFLLQRVAFRALVRSTVTPTVSVDRRVRGLRGGFLVVSNHTSHLDAPIIAQSLPRRQARFLSTGVAHDYFFTSWHRRWFVRWLFNAFPVYRTGTRSSSDMPRTLLRTGLPVLLFPEGGRQKDGVIADFKMGAIKLSLDAEVPILPAAVVGGFEAMPKGRSWPIPGRPPIRVIFGRPVTPRRNETLAELTARVQRTVEELYDTGADVIGVPRLHSRRKDEGTTN